MNHLKLIFKLEATSLSRSRLFRVAVSLLLLVGLYAIFYGKTEMRRQKEVLTEIRADEAQKMKALKSKITTDTLPNVVGNRTFRLVENAPSDWASLSVGQRDIFPYHLYVRYWSLSRQILTAEIANPEKLLTGNFDLAFVLIYIFPLFIIALSYNLISGEREGGTLSLLLSNPITESQITYFKIAFHGLLSYSIALLLVVLAIVICGIALDSKLVLWLLTIALYFAFWYGIVLIISQLKRNSSFNALSLLGVWIVVVIILPTLINLYLSSVYAAPPKNDLTQAIRHEYEEIWEKYDDKKHRFATAQRLAVKYPAYQSDTSYNWEDKYMLAEYDFYDDRLAPVFDKYQKLSVQKESLGEKLSVLSAAALAQQIFNGIAQTDTRHHYYFLDEVKRFHAELKVFFYTKVFQNKPFRMTDFEKIPTYKANPQGNDTSAVLTKIGALLLSTLLVWTVGLLGLFQQSSFTYRSSVAPH